MEAFDVVVVGAGFSGIAVGIGLQERGIDDFVIVERSDEVGGTWAANTYPGCACDVASVLYSYSFAPNPHWRRAFSHQDEICAYLRRVVADNDLCPHLRLSCGVTSSRWDEAAQRWTVKTGGGTFSARVLVSAAGALSDPFYPDVPGLDQFGGHIVHTAAWPADLHLAGKRVGVIGTGASSVQVVPAIADEVASLTVFQRTPAWIVPRRDQEWPQWRKNVYERIPLLQKAMRGSVYVGKELLGYAMSHDPRLLGVVQYAARKHLETQVRDPALRALLTPDYRIGCKRILNSDDFYPALQRPNVELVAAGVTRVDATGVTTADGGHRDLDVLVFATGFRVTEPPSAETAHGVDGVSLAETWRGSPEAYLGVAVAGFPNLFLMLGPNTGLGHTSIVYMIESQARYVCDAVARLVRGEWGSVEVDRDQQQTYVRDVDERMRRSVWMTGGCHSWYLDRTGRNSTLWPDVTWRYRRRLRSFDPTAYRITPRRGASLDLRGAGAVDIEREQMSRA